MSKFANDPVFKKFSAARHFVGMETVLYDPAEYERIYGTPVDPANPIVIVPGFGTWALDGLRRGIEQRMDDVSRHLREGNMETAAWLLEMSPVRTMIEACRRAQEEMAEGIAKAA